MNFCGSMASTLLCLTNVYAEEEEAKNYILTCMASPQVKIMGMEKNEVMNVKDVFCLEVCVLSYHYYEMK